METTIYSIWSNTKSFLQENALNMIMDLNSFENSQGNKTVKAVLTRFDSPILDSKKF